MAQSKKSPQMDLSQSVEGCQCTCAPIYMTHKHPELILALELISQSLFPCALKSDQTVKTWSVLLYEVSELVDTICQEHQSNSVS